MYSIRNATINQKVELNLGSQVARIIDPQETEMITDEEYAQNYSTLKVLEADGIIIITFEGSDASEAMSVAQRAQSLARLP